MPLFNQLEEIQMGIAARKRHVLVGRTIEMETITLRIDKHNGGIEVF
jgi:hypothetical protein